MCYISLERVKLCRHNCMIFARLFNAKMKIHVFENYMVIYTGRKMDDNQGDFREEQWAYCKIRGLLGKSASEIKSELDTLYGENALSYRTVARWVSYFKKSRSSVKGEARPGRPVSATSENDVATVQSIVQQDLRLYGGRDKWFIGLEFVICLYYPERKKAIRGDGKSPD